MGLFRNLVSKYAFDDIKVSAADDVKEFNVDAEIKNTIEDRKDEIWPGDILDYTLTYSGNFVDNDKKR